MSETKLEVKSGAHSEKSSLASEISSLAKITVASENFFDFFYFFLSNKISNK